MSRARLLVPVVVALGLVGAVAGPASAHVTVRADDAKAGGYAKLTFRVPDESADARTVQVRVDLPTDAPFASVSVEPQPGWTWTSTEGTLPKPITTDDGDTVTRAVTSITWKAAGAGLRPGEFGEFALSVGPLPDRPALAFPATQTYSDGQVVRWDEVTPAGGAEPEHPSPTVTLTAATPAGSMGSGSDGNRALAIVGLVLGVLGALTGGLALARTRRPRRPEGAAA
jgi:uncharacterized protein